MVIHKPITLLMCVILHCNARFDLDFQQSQPYVNLPRFWTNSGLSPSAPLPFNRTNVVHQLLTDHMHLNMEYVAALPNFGITHIPIHWLLSLVEFKGFDEHKVPQYDFTALDTFVDHLLEIHLYPVIEFMGDIFPKNHIYGTKFMWKDFVYQLSSRFLSRYGQWNLMNFRFELWNEPDLTTYNILNYTFPDYLEYAYGVASGLAAAARRINPPTKIPLRGPAGLFKSIEKHPLCWGLLNECNEHMSLCPIDVITFHRKGINNPKDVLLETLELVKMFGENLPNLKEMPYANTEADPSSGWSKMVKSYADVHYAHTLISIVLQHWNALLNGSLKHLESISHDNAFLSYHPFEFEQRTMLSRFAMNNTQPESVRFIQKPVYAALGMLSSLASTAIEMNIRNNVSYVLSLGQKYAAVLVLSAEHYVEENVLITLNSTLWFSWGETFAYFVEFLDQQRTNPYIVWTQHNKPPYPNATVLAEMLHAQGPHVMKSPKIVEQNENITINIKFHHPWVVLVRICAASIPPPSKVKNVRIYSLDKNIILIFWNDDEYVNYERCIRTYEIFFAPFSTVNGTNSYLQWELITKNKHIPFLSFCHQILSPNQHLEGYYKIRSIDLFGRYSEFSTIHKFQRFTAV